MKIKKSIKLFIILISFALVTTIHAIPPPTGVPIIAQRENAELGKKLMQELRQHAIIVDDPIIQNYIQTLGQRLLSHTESSLKKFHFFILQDSSINAFAMPGGYIGINSGLLLSTRTESELAAVLAHEIAHITQHHLERLLEQVDNINIPATAALMATLLLGASSGSASTANAATGAAMAVMAGSTQHLLNFTRSNEAEADRIGMKTLYNAGFDPEAMPNFFEQMERANIEYGNQLPPYLLTHPVTGTRIADSRGKAELYPKKNFTSSLAYSLIKVRIQVLMIREKYRALSVFKSLSTRSDAERYGYALAAFLDRKVELAKENIDILLKKNSDIIYQLLLAQILSVHNLPGSLSLLQQQLTIHATYYPLIIQYASTLIDNNQAQPAEDFLNQFSATYSDDLMFLHLLSQAQAKNKNLAEAYITRAKMYEIQGYFKQALILLQQALKLPKIDITTKNLINKKISYLKMEIQSCKTC